MPGNDLAIDHKGQIYVTDPSAGRLWMVNAKTGEKKTVAEDLRPNGVILWPKEGTLVVTDSDQPHLWTFRVEADGRLTHRERYYGPLQLPLGSSATLTCAWDNPTDQTITWGDGTNDEMCLVYLYVVY